MKPIWKLAVTSLLMGLCTVTFALYNSQKEISRMKKNTQCFSVAVDQLR